MRENPRRTALAFLTGEHLLTEQEAEQALVVAETVIRAGLERLDTAVASGDLSGCLEASHALKGNFLNLGLAALSDLAQGVGTAAKHGDTDACRRLAGELERALASFGG